jgi:predicted aspartyl protease
VPLVFPYDSGNNPPAPVILVTLESLDRSARTDLYMIVDTGADRTILPLSIAEDMKLTEVECREIVGLNGIAETYSIVEVRLRIHGGPTIRIKAAVGHPDSEPLVGRDVLNQFRIVHDGPNLQLEIS